jgi:hypothetical protein
LPAQFGTQSHRPATPAPRHFVPVGHVLQAAPPTPHALSAPPAKHVLFWQQPLHEVVSHAHPLPSQWRPCGQMPDVQIPAQLSLSPQPTPVQFGVQGPEPHVFTPAPPQLWPSGHPPHWISVPQWPRNVPHLPAQSRASSATQIVPSAVPPSAAAAAPSAGAG